MDRGHSMDGNEFPSTNFAVAGKDEGDDIAAAAARHVTAANMTAAATASTDQSRECETARRKSNSCAAVKKIY